MEAINRCMGCMKEIQPGARCPHCGYQDIAARGSSLHLPPRTVLKKRFVLGKVLGQGGFGITYLGWDDMLNIKLAIKEFMPTTLVTRMPGDTSVMLTSPNHNETYKYGLTRFLDEAKTLAKLHEVPGVVTIQDYFEANGTAYIVMAFIEGITLKQYLNDHGGRMGLGETMGIVDKLCDTLDQVHAQKILHRDISPDNIYLTSNGQVKLLDFGAARYALGDRSQSLSVILKHGYAPEEQYRSKGQQGPWTDVYALGATVYRMLTGEVPPDSMDRLYNDELKPLSAYGVVVPPYVESAIYQAMGVRQQDRFQTVGAFRAALHGQTAGNVPLLDKNQGQAPGWMATGPAMPYTTPVSGPTGPSGPAGPLPGQMPPATGTMGAGTVGTTPAGMPPGLPPGGYYGSYGQMPSPGPGGAGAGNGKKILAAAAVLGILLVVGIVAGAWYFLGDSTTDDSKNGKDKTAKTTKPPTFEEMRQKAGEVDEMSYDMVMTLDGTQSLSAAIARKGNKSRMETSDSSIGTIVMITDLDTQMQYFYDPISNQAVESPITTESGYEDFTDPYLMLNQIDETRVTYKGEDKFDGKDAYTYNYDDVEGNTVIWLWKKNGLPLKFEGISDSQQMIMQYNNYDLNSQDDSLFQLPAGASVISE